MLYIFRDKNKLILRDSKQRILAYLEQDSLIDNVSFEDIVAALHNSFIQTKYRLSVLNPDETIQYIIPSSDLVTGGISYNENYQQGQRRSLTIKINNTNGQYLPMVNKGNKYIYDILSQKNIQKRTLNSHILIWKNTLFKFDIGLKVKDDVVWFSKGIFCVGSIEAPYSNSERTITLQLKDKFARLEDNNGKLLTAYEIKEGVLARQVIKDLLNQDFGNGYALDMKKPLIDSSLYDFKLQADIKKEAGDNIGAILLEIATQMSAECYYNEEGNLMFIPLNDTLNDNGKSVCWQYTKQYKEILSINQTYEFENAVNIIKVIGDNVDTGIYSATVVNSDPRSPISTGYIGKCPDDPITNTNVWNNILAKDLARYNLRKKSLIPLSISAVVKWNPILSVDFLCELENEYFDYKREKCVINSISYSDHSGEMSLTMTNIQDLQFISAEGEGLDE